MGRLFLCFCIGMLSMLSPRAYADTAQFNVYDSNGAWIGLIDTISTAQSGAQYYNRSNASANPDFEPQNGGLHLFLHRNTITGEYSIGLVADSRNDNSGGRLRGSLNGLGATSFLALADEASEVSMPTPGTAVFNFRWFNCCSDGFVVGGIDPNTLSLNFDITSSTGLTDFYFAGPGGALTSAPLGASALSFTVAAAPEPSTWALMIMGFMFIARQVKHKKSAPQEARLSENPLAVS